MTVTTIPRIGFLGVGRLGRHRMEVLARDGLARVAAIADPQAEALEVAGEVAPEAGQASSLEELLEHDLDGIVIATPSALHADHAVAALNRGLAVFCQKPLGRNAEETRQVLRAARDADRLLTVDLPYRYVDALRAAHLLAVEGEIGMVHSLDLAFHDTHGPDESWPTRAELSGVGCLIDLGTHLVDLALWLTGATEWEVEGAQMHPSRRHGVEEEATAELTLANDVKVRLACSWHPPAAGKCSFGCTIHGSEGTISAHNVDGSFHDFRAELRRGTSVEALIEPPDAWNGRAIGAWTQQLASNNRYDSAADGLELLAEAVDDLYAEVEVGQP